MKKYLILIVAFFLSFNFFSQDLSLNDLINMLNQNNWESINGKLLSKGGWEFYESSQGDELHYNTITWSLNRQYDKANAWFYSYTYEGTPGKISYNTFSKKGYSKIYNSLKSYGFKSVGSEIKDNFVIATYKSSKYILEIETGKRENSYSEDITSYTFTCIKKSSVYDPNNGTKQEFYSNGNKQYSLTLKDGKIDGLYKSYFKNGQLELSGYYKNGKRNGIFHLYSDAGKLKKKTQYVNDIEEGEVEEYNDYGKLEFKYFLKGGDYNGAFKCYKDDKLSFVRYMKDGKFHGKYTSYDVNGNIEEEGDFINGKKNGAYTIYEENLPTFKLNYLNDSLDGAYEALFYSNRLLEFRVNGQFSNGKKIGDWTKYKVVSNDVEEIVRKDFFINGRLSGESLELDGDRVIVVNYENGITNGPFRLYKNGPEIKSFPLDTVHMDLFIKGQNFNGSETGLWEFFDSTNSRIKTGFYEVGLKTGRWSYYHSKIFDKTRNEVAPFSNKLFKVEHYHKDELDGEKQIFSSFDGATGEYKRFNVVENYYRGEKNGDFKFVSEDELNITTGFYKDDKKTGFWVFKEPGKVTKGNYLKGLKTGQWETSVPKSKVKLIENYSEDKLNGLLTLYIDDTKSKEANFEDDNIVMFQRYNDYEEVYTKYEITERRWGEISLKYFTFIDSGSISQCFHWNNPPELDFNSIEQSFLEKLEKFSKNQEFLANSSDEFYLEGPYSLFNLNNEEVIKGQYLSNKADGVWEFRDMGKKVLIKVQYHLGKVIKEEFLNFDESLYSGKYERTKNGQREIIKIKEGLRHGPTSFYDLETGKKTRTVKYKDGKLK